VLEQTTTAYVPGQHHARIIDPKPHRDRADLAAILTYVDDEGRACSVTCLRYRDKGWRSVKLNRCPLHGRSEPATAAGAPDLTGVLLETVEAAAVGVEPFPFEEPSEEEQEFRRFAHALYDKVAGEK
jgi:hypothetical protein